MKRYLLCIICCFVLGVFFVTIDESSQLRHRYYLDAQLNGVQLQLETAENSSEWYQGLSTREQLCENCGMIFIFPEMAKRSFVMRDMKFPLDILWIKSGELIGFEQNLLPENEPYSSYNSPEPVDIVIELPGGFIEKNKIQKTDTITIL